MCFNTFWRDWYIWFVVSVSEFTFPGFSQKHPELLLFMLQKLEIINLKNYDSANSATKNSKLSHPKTS